MVRSETNSKMDSAQKKTFRDAVVGGDNPIRTREADYPDHSTTGPPRFLDGAVPRVPCIIDCAVGIKVLKQDRNKEPLESRLERDDVKHNFRKNYIEKEIVKSNIVHKNSNVKVKNRNGNRNRNKKAAETEKKSGGESSKQLEQNEKKDDANNIRNIYVVGQDKASESIQETVDDLIDRDYPIAAIFDGSDDGDVGVIVVPEDCHIPRRPAIIEPGKAHSILKENPTNNKFKVIFLKHRNCLP